MDELREQAVVSMMTTLGWTREKSVHWEHNLYNSGWKTDSDYVRKLYSFIDNAVTADNLQKQGANI